MPREDAVSITPITIDSTFADLKRAELAHVSRWQYLADIRLHLDQRKPFRIEEDTVMEVLLLEAVWWWMRPSWVLDLDWPMYINVAHRIFGGSKRQILLSFQPLTPRRAWPHLHSLDRSCE